MGLRLSAVVAALVAVTATSTATLAAGQPLEFAQVCLRYEADIDTITDTLAESGWEQTAETDTLIEGLTWIGTTEYFASDSGGERLETILALKAKTAAALLRKKDIPQSKGRFLTRGEDVLYVMWRQPSASVTEIACHAALSAQSTQQLLAHVDASDFPDFKQLPTEITENGRVSISLLNTETLSPLTPPSAVLKTYHTSQSQ